jgi:hypothetical protein
MRMRSPTRGTAAILIYDLTPTLCREQKRLAFASRDQRDVRVHVVTGAVDIQQR